MTGHDSCLCLINVLYFLPADTHLFMQHITETIIQLFWIIFFWFVRFHCCIRVLFFHVFGREECRHTDAACSLYEPSVSRWVSHLFPYYQHLLNMQHITQIWCSYYSKHCPAPTRPSSMQKVCRHIYLAGRCWFHQWPLAEEQGEDSVLLLYI